MFITGTHFNYYMICHRKLWLFANGMHMEHSSDLVYEGKLIQAGSYWHRSERFQEVALDGIKVDYYDPQHKVIHEVKKSDKRNEAHIWQLKYYLWVFLQNGIVGARGILEYPKLRKTEEVLLSHRDEKEIETFLEEIRRLTASKDCPEKLPRTKCKNCSYFDFCYSGESSE